jgi:arabinogalactan oligomer/maltooligosaccharide transport system substrate-binding protein
VTYLSRREAISKTTAVILVVVIVVAAAAALILTRGWPTPPPTAPTPTPTPPPTGPAQVTIGNVSLTVPASFAEFVEKAKRGEVSVTIYFGLAHAMKERPAFYKVIDMFEREYPGIDVRVLEYADWGSMQTRIAAIVALPKEERAAYVGQAPDVFSWAHDWIGYMADAGYIIALEDYIGADAVSKISEYIIPVAMSAVTYRLKTYGLPYAGEALAIYVNTRLVPQPPTTFSELKSIMEQFYKPAEGTYGISGQLIGMYHINAWVTAFGGHFYDPTLVPKLAINSTATKEGVKFFISNVLRYMYVGDLSHEYQRELFIKGKTPFYISGPWDMAYVRDALGLDNFTVIPFPKIDDKVPKPWSGFRNLYISVMAETGGIERTYASILFVLYVALSDKALLVFVDENGYVPVKISVAEYVKARADVNPLYKVITGFYNQVLVTKPMPNDADMQKVWGADRYFQAIWSEYAKALQEGLSEDRAVERAIAIVDEQLDAAQAEILQKIGG